MRCPLPPHVPSWTTGFLMAGPLCPTPQHVSVPGRDAAAGVATCPCSQEDSITGDGEEPLAGCELERLLSSLEVGGDGKNGCCWTVPTPPQGTQRTSILFLMFLYFALKKGKS